MQPDCPEEDTLLAFADGALDPAESARLEHHVAHCHDCRAVLASLARLSQPVPPPSVSAPVRRGMPLGRYIVIDCIGAGGMGAVYAAYDPELDRKVALKVLRSEGADQQHLLEEARALARLQHPNVVAVYDVGALDGRVFIAMELLAGKSLRAWFAGGRALSELLDVFIGCGRGLQAAHAAGLTHRDFKPENVRVSEDGRARVLDFGLAHAPQRAIAGTPAYMAPEQQGGSADVRSDQYAFCVCLHEALFGALPGQPPQREPKVPGALAAALRRGLSAEPFARHDSMEALVHALERVRSAGTRRSAVAAVLGLVGIAALGGAALGRRQSLECTGAEQQIAQAWSPERATKLREAFVAAKVTAAEQRAGRTIQALDTWAAAWTVRHREACEATRVRGEQSEELMQRRMRCLDVQRGRLAAVVELLAEGGAATMERASEAVGALPQLSECADARVLLERIGLPQDEAVRARIDATSKKLAEAMARKQLWRFEEGLVIAKTAAAEAEAIGWAPLVAEVLHQQGAMQVQVGETAVGVDTLWRAVHHAKLGRDARLEAKCWVDLAYAVGDRLRHRADGERLFAIATSQVRGLAEPGELEATLLVVEGAFWRDIGEISRSITPLEKALALREAVRPPNAHQLMQVRIQLGHSLVLAERLSEAEKTLKQVVEMAREDEGIAGKLDSTLTVLADVLSRQGRYDEARAASQQANAIAKRTGEGALRRAYSLEMLGTVERRAGRLDAAAVAFRETADMLRGLPEPNPYPGSPLALMGEMYAENGVWAKAEAPLRESLAIQARALEADDTSPVSTVAALVRTLVAKGDPAGAAKVLESGLVMVAKNKGSASSLAEPRFHLAQAQWELDREKAVALGKLARDGAEGPLREKIQVWLVNRSQ